MSIEGDGPFIITPSVDTFMDWSRERLAEFKETYPTEWEALKRGYVVEVPGLPEEMDPVDPKVVDRRLDLHKTGLQ
jgi:hypothetical protein